MSEPRRDRYSIVAGLDDSAAQLIGGVHLALAERFGLQLARKFPPHITLIGGIESDECHGIALLDIMDNFTDCQALTVRLSRPVPRGTSWICAVEKSQCLLGLRKALLTHLPPTSHRLLAHAARESTADSYEAHMSLATWELNGRPRLSRRAGEFLSSLDFLPLSCRLERLMLLRLTATWGPSWWHDVGIEVMGVMPLRATGRTPSMALGH
jgi:hypothetical protein